jgi:hypothetical protein
VDIVGYRIHDPCTGAVLAAAPAAAHLAADPATCTGADLAALHRAAHRPGRDGAGAVDGGLPAQLTPADIQVALREAGEHARTCFGYYGVPGTAQFRLTVSGAGKIVRVEQVGDFIDTPTGACIAEKVRDATFPRTRNDETPIEFPFVLQ